MSGKGEAAKIIKRATSQRIKDPHKLIIYQTLACNSGASNQTDSFIFGLEN